MLGEVLGLPELAARSPPFPFRSRSVPLTPIFRDPAHVHSEELLRRHIGVIVVIEINDVAYCYRGRLDVLSWWV